MDTLAYSRVLENTIVIITSGNGGDFFTGKSPFSQGNSLNATIPLRRHSNPKYEWRKIIDRNEYLNAFFYHGATGALSSIRSGKRKLFLNAELTLYNLETDPGERNPVENKEIKSKLWGMVILSQEEMRLYILNDGNKSKEGKGDYSNFNTSPAFVDGMNFSSARVSVGLRGVSLSSKVYCVDPKTYEIQWTFPDGGGLLASAVASGRVYIASGNIPFFYCLDHLKGKPHWIFKHGNRVEESTLCIYRKIKQIELKFIEAMQRIFVFYR